jgi:uncharacterized protein YidB (DUF937 family)
MSRGPLTALLAVLAVAGYQNRDKIAEVLRNLAQSAQNPSRDGTAPAGAGGIGDILGRLSNGGLGRIFGNTSPGGILSGGLGGLLDQFRNNGVDKADSWVNTGPNDTIEHHELSKALGPDVIDELVTKTGLSKEEILSRLSRDLPKAVDDLTPDGKLPTEHELTDPVPSLSSRSSVPNVGTA